MDYVIYLAALIGIMALAGVGLSMLLGYSGAVTLAHAAWMGLGAYAYAIVAARVGGPWWLALGLAVAVAVLICTATGVLLLRMDADEYLIGSYALQAATVVLLIRWTDLTGGHIGIVAPRAVDVAVLAAGTWLLLLVFAVCGWRFGGTRLGVYVRAGRDDPVAAQASGLNAASLSLGMLAISAGLAALAGVLLAMLVGYITPETFDVSLSISLLTIVILGGAANPIGAIAGAVVLIGLPQALTFAGIPDQVIADITEVIIGLVLAVLMWLRPHGLLPERHLSPTRKSDSSAKMMKTQAWRDGPTNVTTSGLSKAFGGTVALSDVSVSFERGKIYGIIGPNGAGKTTLLNVLAGWFPPDAGSIAADGRVVSTPGMWRRAREGWIRTFQDLRLFSRLTVWENVVAGGAASTPAHRAHLATATEEHSARWTSLPSELAYGHQKTVAVSRAMAGCPSLLLLDEPFSGLTSAEIEEISARLIEARESRITIVIEHNVAAIARLADELIAMSAGRVAARGEPAQVMRELANVPEFLFAESDMAVVADR